jgi:hypothetical protein
MADDSTDTAFGFILFILFLALLGYAAGGISSTPSTAGTTSGTTQSLPPLEGSSVTSCQPSTFRLVKRESQTVGVHGLELTIYVDPVDAGTKCADARTTTATEGTVKVTLAYTADETQNVSDTDSCSDVGCQPRAFVQVNGTDNLCVSAVAESTPEGSQGVAVRVSIPKVVEPCAMTVPATQPARPMPGITAGNDKEKEEGY